MSEVDGVDPLARSQAGLLAHRTRDHGLWTVANRKMDALNDSPSHRDELPRDMFEATRSGSGESFPARIHRSVHSCGDSPRLPRLGGEREMQTDNLALPLDFSTPKPTLGTLAFPFHLAQLAPGREPVASVKELPVR